ncbi:cell division protein ZipA C-terminal FtsZ-binding domain-containing protein [Chitinimonas viridis]|uniref:Cell division protein ZipA n=1 Tax=Chitinimonas viridis TaxID=664880 RepID=A0ABT8BBY5_9NEIS|nr:cell division protein ZipA C-terminal FtsZ-binding domain-containing protein [Chitinimonas viridis]MDN3579071.1 cell division protein ZipA C-terminal FtsZ-binding domain-containing protein [Chitinimonas viridis]
MTDFHWITLSLGLALVGGVWGYNSWQEWRFKKRAADAFAKSHPDVLLDTPKNMVRQGETGMRFEPSLDEPAPVLGTANNAPETVDLSENIALAVAVLDPSLDFIAEVHPGEPVDFAVVPQIEVGKRVKVLGLNEGDEWELIRPGQRYNELRVGLQLVDRQGPVSEAQMVRFCEALSGFAASEGGVATFPRREDKLHVAKELDAFCVEVDMQIGLNVVSSRAPFPINRVAAMAEAAGLVLEADGVFHARSESGKTLFSLADRHHRPIDALDDTPSITILLDVPRVAGGEQAFDRIADLAQQMALTLGGDLVDDDNRSLKPADLAAIRKQLVGIYARMDDRGIPAGGVAALRLFA